ncbi:Abi family protein [Clostridium novyi]|uniref:Abi family protein n=1 Tax=Clostridium novyi TaxID=1542 RepID=UPI001FA6C82E|nr:Abi family protein [Clostridium novyi]
MNSIIKLKKPKSFDEQIEILRKRGLIIDNEEEAKFILSNVNYYRFTAYLLTFKKEDDKYKSGTSFTMISHIYKFDRELRNLLIGLLGNIEISFRTYIAYTLAMNHGADGYLYKSNFINDKFHERFLSTLQKEKEYNSNKLFIKHHNQKYNGQLPIWVATEIMTFGTLSKLYANLLPKDKSYIKNNLCSVNPKLVNAWLQSLTHIRNQCAHYGRIYNEVFPDVKIKNQDKKYKIDSKRIFANILIMKYLISDKAVWNKFFASLKKLINEYKKYIDLKLIGFPTNWIEILSNWY